MEKDKNGIPTQVELAEESYSVADNGFHSVSGQVVNSEGKVFKVSFVRNSKATYWLLASVKNANGKEHWGFRTSGFKGRGQMFVVNDQPVIASINQKNCVLDVRFFCDFGNTTTFYSGGVEMTFGGKSPEEVISAKMAIARQQNWNFELTELEKEVFAANREIREAKQKAENEERERLRVERRKRILGRPTCYVYNSAGRRFAGTPVTEEEWMVLSVSMFGVLVETYDDETSKAGKALMFFKVVRTKKKQKSRQSIETLLFTEKPAPKSTAKKLEVSAILKFKVDGQVVVAPVVTTDQMNELKKKFNSGTPVAVHLRGEGPEAVYQVNTLVAGSVKTLTEASPLQ